MATAEQTKIAKDFSEYWKDKGAEKTRSSTILDWTITRSFRN